MTGGDRALVTVATLLGVVALNACGAGGGGEPTGWSAPELLGDGGTSSGSGPDVAASAGGDAVAVWSTWETLLARRFSRGQGWMPVERIDQGAPNSHKAQRVAMDPSGHAIAVWSEPHGVWANRYVAGRGWSGPVRISNAHIVTVRNPWFSGEASVVMDGSGNALVVWNHNDPTTSVPDQVWWNRFTVAGGWGTPQQLQAGRRNEVSPPDVAVSPSGEAVAVWLRSPYGGTPPQEIWAAAFLPGRSWQTPTPIEPADSLTWVYRPRVAMDARGNAIVVWNRDDQVLAQRFVAGAGRTEAEPIGLGAGAEVATDAQGNAFALWGHQRELMASRFVVGRSWTAAERVADGSGGVLAVEPAGNAWVAWAGGSDRGITTRRFLVRQGWEAPAAAIEGRPDVFLTDIAVDAAGNAFVVWREGHGDELIGQRVSIWARRFVAN